MIANVMLQRLFEICKEFWTFKADGDPLTREFIARQQLKLIADVSRIVAILTLPIGVYMVVDLFIFASQSFILVGLFGMGVVTFISVRNFRRPDLQGADIKHFYALRQTLCVESIIVVCGLNLCLAVPLAFGQIPFNDNSLIMALGSIVIGGFSYGSIPRAQTFYIAIQTILLAFSFLFVKGAAGVPSVALLMFFAVAVDSIYRLSFLNFVKRHIYAAKQKDAAETVKLLLNDYAEQSSDWLWETDECKRIAQSSERFALAAGMATEDLDGTHIVDLFAESAERQSLLQLIERGESVRNLALPISVQGEVRWWRISCRFMNSSNGASGALRGVATDITIAKQAKDQIAHLAHFDSLTDLPNRSSFHQSLQHSVTRLKSHQQLAVLYLDIDRFKEINDTMGHRTGDLVLQEVGNRLSAAVGSGDVVARLSGDEFAVCLNHIDSTEDVIRTASEIVEKVSAPLEIDGHRVVSGVSLGVAVSNEESDTAEGLLQYADIALYKSKQNGRGCVTIFEPYMLTAIQDRRTIELDLLTALKGREFELHYQPLCDIETREPIGYEALIRWNHPTKGMIAPNDFIPVAETTGMIIQLGEWVIRTALDELKNWPEHLSVSVNLSPAQMHSPNLLPTIVHALASAGVEPHRLELEITETVIMTNNQANFDLLNKIRSLGIKIALDDFGTGYSSLNYLRSFPFDKIKIDRCFVEEVVSREDCQAIIRSITGLASSLGMVTTAEGIECEEQLAQLKIDGCQQAQGYLFSKAIPASEIEGRVVNAPTNIAVLDHMSKSNFRSKTGFEQSKRQAG